MSDKKLVVLGVVAAVMLVLAVVQSKIVTGPADISQGVAPLVQGLDPDVIAAIHIKGEDEVTLERKSTGFVVADKFGYPAQAKRVNELIQKVLDIQTVEHMTDNPANFADLGVDANSARIVVEFRDKDGNVMTGAVISETQNGKTYVRQPNSDHVYEAKSTAWIQTKMLDYLEQRIANIDQKDIAKVTLTSADGSYSITSEPNSTDVKVEKTAPEGKKFKAGEPRQVFSVMTALRFEDVMPDSDLAFRDTYVCKLHKPITYTAKLAVENDKTFAKIAAMYTGPEQITKADRVETQQELKEKEALLLAQNQAKEFNARHSKWVYQIPGYQAKNLTRKFEDLLENIEEKKQEEPAQIQEEAAETETEPAPDAEDAQAAPAVEEKPRPQEPNAPTLEMAEPTDE